MTPATRDKANRRQRRAELSTMHRDRAKSRKRLRELDAVETRTEAQDKERSEIIAQFDKWDDREIELRCEETKDLEADDKADELSAEAAEYRALTDGFECRSVFDAVTGHRMPGGRTAELQQHHGFAGNVIPAEIALQWHGPDGKPIEHRAVTPGPTDVGATEYPVAIPIYATGLGAFLSWPSPIVESGDFIANALGTRATVGGPHAASEDVDETDGTFSSSSLKPERGQASFFYRRVDAARSPQTEQALRASLQGGLAEWLDGQKIAEWVTIGRTDAGAADTYGSMLNRFVYANVDGRHAVSASDIRLVMGATGYGQASELMAQGDTAIDKLSLVSGGLRVSPLIAAAQASKQDVLVRKGFSTMDAVQPVWRGVEIERDPYTKAGTGEIVLTAYVMSNKDIIRAAGFARVQMQWA